MKVKVTLVLRSPEKTVVHVWVDKGGDVKRRLVEFDGWRQSITLRELLEKLGVDLLSGRDVEIEELIGREIVVSE